MKTNLPKSKAKSRTTTYFLKRFNSLRIPSLTIGLLSLPLLAFANMHPGYWTYTVTDLGDFGGSGCEPYAINNSGQVVGRCRFPSNLWHAFLYSNGTLTDLNTLPGLNVSEATAINDSGVVVGYSANFLGSPNPLQNVSAFLMNGGHLYDLPGMAEAHGINSWDLTVGFTGSGAVMWYIGTGSIPLFNAICVNNAGDVAGYLRESNDVFVYHAGTGQLQDLGLLGFYSEAQCMNNSGEIAGSYFDYSSSGGFLYSKGSFRALGPIYPNGINDNGDVVGDLTDSSAHAGVLYNGQSSLQDLNTIVADPTWLLQHAAGINNSGQICGFGVHNGLQLRGFLITPVFHPYFLAQPAKSSSGK
jgi:probable HAF family extracellular repeat protein